MATSPASPEAEGVAPPGRDRADCASPGRLISRWVIPMLLLAVALLAFSTPALAATHAVHAPHATRATAVQASPAASITPAVPGGVCQVPGIGDIGGLVGLCNQGSSGIVGDLNNICQPSLPQPEQATGGINAMVQPPGATVGGKTLYDNYGVAGQFWAAHGLQCSDMTSLIGNNVAGMVFDAAKSMDRVTITVYQSAAGNDILTWLQDAVDGLITALGNAIYFPYLAPVVILGAIWLAWQGLIRKRATRTIEGTLWMVVACVAAIALIGRPAAFTGVGTTVSNGVTQVLNVAFSKLPAPASSNCLPVQAGDPQSLTGDFAYTSGNALVDENANELWSVLVCKPWLYGELGSTAYATSPAGQQTVVNKYGRQLLWSQAIAANETPSTALIQAKQATYSGIASAMQQQDPAVYPLFQGNQWTTRMEISFAAIFASLVAGLLILLIALTLIVLKIGFLLLLVAGPFFLIIGTHPGFGRVIAIRWFEMLVGVLMKTAAIAIVLSVLLYCYSLIMGTADNVLPWALKILMIALVTVAVFIYRKPFSHLFSAVGYGTIGSTERAEYSLREAGQTFRRSTLDAATAAVPAMSSYRAARWARRNPGQAATVAAGAAAGMAAGSAAGTSAAGTAAAATEAAGATAAQAGAEDGYASRLRPTTPPLADGDSEASDGSRRVAGGVSGGTGPARARNVTEADGTSGRVAPPLDLPPRSGSGGASAPNGPNGSAGSAAASANGWSRGAGRSAGTGSRPRVASSAPPPPAPAPSSAGSPPVRSQSRAGGSSPPVSRPAPRPSNGSNGSGGSNGSNGSGGSGGSGGSNGSGGGPAWPASGWPTAGPRQRSGGRARPSPAPEPPAAPADQGGGKRSSGQDEPSAMPFWLRPIRRDK
jgi:TrbL/VirB6 plasmid conjugal transfer protein